MNKRGVYFFVLDAFIGGAIVLVSLLVVLNSYISVIEQERPLIILEDFVSYFQNTQVRDYAGSTVEALVADGSITKTDNTLFDQVAEFHYQGKMVNASNFVADIAGASLPSQMSIRVFYNGDLIFEDAKFPYARASQVLSTKKLSMVTINSSYLYGPHMLEVVMWTS